MKGPNPVDPQKVLKIYQFQGSKLEPIRCVPVAPHHWFATALEQQLGTQLLWVPGVVWDGGHLTSMMFRLAFWGEKENELGIYGKIICSSLLEDRVERFQDGLSMMFSPHLPEFFFGILWGFTTVYKMVGFSVATLEYRFLDANGRHGWTTLHSIGRQMWVSLPEHNYLP